MTCHSYITFQSWLIWRLLWLPWLLWLQCSQTKGGHLNPGRERRTPPLTMKTPVWRSKNGVLISLNVSVRYLIVHVTFIQNYESIKITATDSVPVQPSTAPVQPTVYWLRPAAFRRCSEHKSDSSYRMKTGHTAANHCGTNRTLQTWMWAEGWICSSSTMRQKRPNSSWN